MAKAGVPDTPLRWLSMMKLAYPPFLVQVTINHDVTTPPWVRACWETAKHREELFINPIKFRRIWKHWKIFLLLVEKDIALRDSIDSVARLESPSSQMTIDAVQEALILFTKKSASPFVEAIKHRQEVRMRRIAGKTNVANLPTTSGGDFPMERPSDEDFLKEALPPNPYE